MRISDWLNDNATLVTIGAVVLLTVALGVVVLQLRGPAAPRYEVYFWDVGTGEVFGGDSSQLPPIAAPSGGRGVRAYLYSCGSCTPDQWFGYLETYTDEFHRARDENSFKGMSPPQLQQFTAKNHLVRAVDGDMWFAYDSPQGQAIRDDVQSRCDSPDQLTACGPGA